MIIDGGNVMNIAALDVIEKLQFAIGKHSKPYKATQVDDCAIHVTHQCLVTFKIGIYKDATGVVSFLWTLLISEVVTGRIASNARYTTCYRSSSQHIIDKSLLIE